MITRDGELSASIPIVRLLPATAALCETLASQPASQDVTTAQ